MEAADITAVFFASEEVPMALLFGPEAIVPGRRCAITSLGATFDRPKVLEALKTLFPSHLQIIVWKSAENNPISIESCSLEEMEAAIAFKARGEACNLLGDSQEEFDILKLQFSSALNESERVGVLQQMKTLLYNAVLQNLAANALKEFGSYLDESTDLRMCLLGFRKLFSVNQSRIQPIQNRINRALARAALPRIEDDSKPSPPEVREDSNELSSARKSNSSGKLPDRAPSGRLRKHISDRSSSSSSVHESSSSEVEFPCEGVRTDSDREVASDGNITPIVVNLAPAKQSQSQPIPKKSKKPKKDGKSRKSSSKAQPKKSRVSHKKSKKHKSRKPKHHSSSQSLGSSSDHSDSDSDGDAPDVLPVDQVYF